MQFKHLARIANFVNYINNKHGIKATIDYENLTIDFTAVPEHMIPVIVDEIEKFFGKEVSFV